jgi:hypothetical protein
LTGYAFDTGFRVPHLPCLFLFLWLARASESQAEYEGVDSNLSYFTSQHELPLSYKKASVVLVTDSCKKMVRVIDCIQHGTEETDEFSNEALCCAFPAA